MAGYVYLGSRYIGECKVADGTVSGLMVAPGNIYWTGSSWAIDDVTLSHDTYGASGWSVTSTTGIVSGVQSSYFTYNDLSTIRNLTLSYGGYNDWRIPTIDEINKLYFDTTRDPALLNGNEVRSMPIIINSNGLPAGGTYICNGILIFPNNMSFTMTTTGGSAGTPFYATESELNSVISQGAYFHKIIGCYGFYYSDSNAYWRDYTDNSINNICTLPYGAHITPSSGFPDYILWNIYYNSGPTTPEAAEVYGWGQTYQGNDKVIGTAIRFVRGSITD